MKQIISMFAIVSLLAMGGYMFFEPSLAGAAGGPGAGPYSDSITATQDVTSELSITAAPDVIMSGAILGITGNAGNPRTGSTTWTVITSNTTGFNLTMVSNASTSPAMRLDSTWNFSDYSPVTAGTPDYAWSSPASSQAEFGYTVEPATAADTIAKFKDDGTICGTGVGNTANSCWYNVSTTAETIINRTSDTSVTGEIEKVKFNTESNAKYLKEGAYVADITVTATQN
ncbi:MAG: hypothetical protein Q7T79_02505 [bacterium]|nr:hypothetical protein [bacterium]